MAKYIDVEANAYDYGTLYDWFISSVEPEPPVWTEGHIEELEDFYVIPKSTPAADVEQKRHGRWYLDNGCAFCSECKNSFTPTIRSQALFCTRCGAKMDGGQDDG